MKPNKATPRRRKLVLLSAVVLSAFATVGLTAFLVNIFERKQEAHTPYYPVVELDDNTTDPAVWGRNFPLQYDSYKRTSEQQKTRYGGSEAVRRSPTQVDPRTVVSQDKLKEDPRLVKMWAGYPFATDFREERGHAYMLEDQKYTKRVLDFKQPGTCLNCHASTYVLMKNLGDGDLFKGFDKMNQMTYHDASALAEHPVACIDCHDPKTMKLRITRPAFMEGIKAYKASIGVKDFDVNRDATAQEMRSYVCGQCHVEYYFKGAEKRLTFPWQNGLKVDDALAYYDKVGHSDFVHKESGAKVLKAQHPEFEMYNQGVHAKAGVSCADCHMPYKREGAAKVSDHQLRSPLLNINRSCQTCHRASEEELKGRVEEIQGRYVHSRDVAFNALVELIDDIAAAQKNGTPEANLNAAREFQRKAQFFIDYVEAENSSGFHAPGETLRVLNDATNYIRQGQLALRGVMPPQLPGTR
ncbi:ammonia-forming cytochrome c nitrite reductase subunit c552 [Micromonospora sonneratiae]|uniref:nitrite reductase (cytochrome; ammonia-forming) n=1 Tax=Micromonospora sonneratiae TaxID=1184706 RepID=A0ABW3YBE1_9ACTN